VFYGLFGIQFICGEKTQGDKIKEENLSSGADIAQLARKFPDFNGSRRFLAMFTTYAQ
jgi:hypothetical protein